MGCSVLPSADSNVPIAGMGFIVDFIPNSFARDLMSFNISTRSMQESFTPKDFGSLPTAPSARVIRRM